MIIFRAPKRLGVWLRKTYARTHMTIPIPVVFNLSSFSEFEQSLAGWMVPEFRRGYDVPEKLARRWIAHNEAPCFSRPR